MSNKILFIYFRFVEATDTNLPLFNCRAQCFPFYVVAKAVFFPSAVLPNQDLEIPKKSCKGQWFSNGEKANSSEYSHLRIKLKGDSSSWYTVCI